MRCFLDILFQLVREFGEVSRFEARLKHSAHLHARFLRLVRRRPMGFDPERHRLDRWVGAFRCSGYEKLKRDFHRVALIAVIVHSLQRIDSLRFLHTGRGRVDKGVAKKPRQVSTDRVIPAARAFFWRFQVYGAVPSAGATRHLNAGSETVSDYGHARCFGWVQSYSPAVGRTNEAST